jgi:hypothetical protein
MREVREVRDVREASPVSFLADLIPGQSTKMSEELLCAGLAMVSLQQDLGALGVKQQPRELHV